MQTEWQAVSIHIRQLLKNGNADPDQTAQSDLHCLPRPVLSEKLGHYGIFIYSARH